MRNLREVLAPLGIETDITDVKDLQLDSRKVTSGDVFIAIKGHQLDGGQFAKQAIEKGASAVLADTRCELNTDDERVIQVEQLSLHLAQIAAQFYQHPSAQLDLVGVTGTNGKSTTTAMIATLAKYCQKHSAIIGTLGWGEPNNLTTLTNTTPSSVELQQIFAALQQQGKDLVAMEVSSHGLIQGRVAHTQFKTAVFTNLSRDHLDYHGDMQSYADAKLILMRDCNAKTIVLNQDDAVAQSWMDKYNFEDLVVYGKKSLPPSYGQYVYFSDVDYHSQGLRANLETSWGNATIELGLFGEFNLYNTCAALATLLPMGYDFATLVQGVQSLKAIDGRMEAYSAASKPTCIVDYAHTPDALELALAALNKHVQGKITCVFGCGGDRDKGKRPLMAQAAQKYAKRIIVTNDNPRFEDELSIIDDIKRGFSANVDVEVEPDRAAAIALAVQNANEKDIILIAGKGHEDYQIVGDSTLHFSDAEQVKAALGMAEVKHD